MFRIWNKIKRDTRILFESFGTFCIEAMHFWWLLCDSVVLVLFLRQIRARHYYYLESNNNNNIVVPYGLESTVFPYIRTFYVHTKVWFFFLFSFTRNFVKIQIYFILQIFNCNWFFFYFNNASDVRKTSKGLFLTDLWQFFQFFFNKFNHHEKKNCKWTFFLLLQNSTLKYRK